MKRWIHAKTDSHELRDTFEEIKDTLEEYGLELYPGYSRVMPSKDTIYFRLAFDGVQEFADRNEVCRSHFENYLSAVDNGWIEEPDDLYKNESIDEAIKSILNDILPGASIRSSASGNDKYCDIKYKVTLV